MDMDVSDGKNHSLCCFDRHIVNNALSQVCCPSLSSGFRLSEVSKDSRGVTTWPRGPPIGFEGPLLGHLRCASILFI
jgi:hypothetical protein